MTLALDATGALEACGGRLATGARGAGAEEARWCPTAAVRAGAENAFAESGKAFGAASGKAFGAASGKGLGAVGKASMLRSSVGATALNPARAKAKAARARTASSARADALR